MGEYGKKYSEHEKSKSRRPSYSSSGLPSRGCHSQKQMMNYLTSLVSLV